MFLRKKIRQSYLACLCVVLVTGHATAQQPRSDLVVANDNRRPAGSPDGPVTTIKLVAAQGQWRPEESDGPSLEVEASAEEGGALLAPGPLMRVAEGTDVVVKIHNTLAERLDVHGLVTHPSDTDSVFPVAAGETRQVRFSSGAPGTDHYWATTAGAALAPGEAAAARHSEKQTDEHPAITSRHITLVMHRREGYWHPEDAFDPARDHVVLLGMEGPKDTVRYQRFPVVLNGDERLSIAMKAGVPNRFRLINITTNFGGLNVSLVAFNQPV